MTTEQALALADEDSPVFLTGGFGSVAAAWAGTPKYIEAFRTGKVVGWHEQDPRLFRGTIFEKQSFLCTMASKSQEIGLALGAQAGEARWREILTASGFSRFRRATETPVNSILEGRP